jgi:hypothetical protein
VTGPPLLRRVLDYRFKDADGTPLSRQAEAFDVGFWWLRCEGNTQVFLVGTQAEYNAVRSEPKEGGDRHSPGGKGDGRGRRNHRVNPASFDSGGGGL